MGKKAEKGLEGGTTAKEKPGRARRGKQREVDATGRTKIRIKKAAHFGARTRGTSLASCTLEIGGRIVARAEGGPFDAEYALFEAHEIELHSNNEPGTVREHGYRTTAEFAAERLEMEGATRALAEAAAGERGALATAYALGPEVRRVATLLTAAELFEGRVWQAGAKQYEGGGVDGAALGAGSGIDGGGGGAAE